MGYLRFLLAAIVVISHSGGEIFGFKMMSGGVCVELFFIISGFYMQYILEQQNYALKINFYISRFLRIFPLFIIVSFGFYSFDYLYEFLHSQKALVPKAVTYAENNSLLSITRTLSNLFMFGQDVFSWFYIAPNGEIFFFKAQHLSGIDKSGLAWAGELRNNGPAWSIGVEIWFYLLVPFLFRIKTIYLIIICLLSIFLKLYLSKTIGLHVYFFFPSQFYLFILGMIARRFVMRFENKIGLGAAILLMIGIVFFEYVHINSNFLRYFVLPSLLVLSINHMFLITIRSKINRFIGDLSYPIYITHSFISLLIPKILGYNSSIVFYLIVLLISMLWVWKAELYINTIRWSISKKQA
jgi:peptidoglycan/LPS O-acetylase OafA/YrhL